MKEDWKKEIVKKLKTMSGRYSSYEIFTDWITAMALTISNTTDLVHGPVWKAREQLYGDIFRKHGAETMEMFGDLMGMLVLAAEEEMTDLLGEIYMEAGMGSSAAGQFFTPFHVSEACAKLALEDYIRNRKGEKLQLYEPTCGGGGMIIAAAKILKEAGVNYQKCVRIVAQDLDYKAVYMTYVMCSVIGIKATVVQGNTLQEPYPSAQINPDRIWKTPAEKGMLI